MCVGCWGIDDIGGNDMYVYVVERYNKMTECTDIDAIFRSESFAENHVEIIKRVDKERDDWESKLYNYSITEYAVIGG